MSEALFIEIYIPIFHTARTKVQTLRGKPNAMECTLTYTSFRI